MYVDLNHNYSPEKLKELEQIVEILKFLEPTVTRLLADHRKNSRRWMPHEVVPWGMGRDYVDEPWKPELFYFLVILVAGALFVQFDFVPRKISFKKEIEPMFDKHCLICHQADMAFPDLSTEKTAAYLNSLEDYIDTLHPDSSFLYQILLVHPNDSLEDTLYGPLTPIQLQIIYGWIQEGARDN